MLDPLTHRLLAGAGTRGPLVLMYHSVEPGRARPPWRWALSLSRFRQHLALLHAEGWSTCRVSQLTTGEALPPRTVAITFDDGYADNLHAVEELARHAMTATFFVVSNDIGAVSAWEPGEASPRPMLSAADLREMQGQGLEIGSHTRSHPRLTTLTDDAVGEEVAGSKAALEDLLGAPVQGFAYPYGLHDERAVAAVQAAGYTSACSTRSGVYTGDDPLRIPRLSVFNTDTPGRLARKLGLSSNNGGWGSLARYYGARLGGRLRPGQRPAQARSRGSRSEQAGP
jgi:peptidoglycan/xylan/chitin deacetylase (PgdA/CDA1 family)